MKAQDLRIGNLVTDNWGSSIYEVDSINSKGISLFVEDDGNWSELAKKWVGAEYEFEDIKGIELTEEWLIKLGLIPDRSVLFELPISIQEKCKGDMGFKKSAFFFNNREDVNMWMDCQTRVCVKYVHEVQNLVYALTGEELDVKL